MPNTLFSTYSQGENRVTASILAVFERISFALTEKILQGLTQESGTSLLSFENQPAGIDSVPDAVIRASFAYWIETKIVPNTVRKGQIEGHLRLLDQQTHTGQQRLIVITPDAVIPDVISELDDDRLVWVNFDTLVEVITSAVVRDEAWLTSESPIPTEREQELLRELVKFLESEGLTGIGDQALVVAARKAYPEYLAYSAYICQPDRSFRPCSHIAFYVDGCVQRQIPKILTAVESVELSLAGIDAAIGLTPDVQEKLHGLVRQLEQDESERYGELHKVLFLSGPKDDVDTIQLKSEIINDQTSDNGRTIAFVQGHRYVSMTKFDDDPTVTSDLLD